MADKCFSPLGTLSPSAGMAPLFSFLKLKQEQLLLSKGSLQYYAAVLVLYLSTCSEFGILTFNSFLYPSKCRPLLSLETSYFYCWVMTSFTSIGFVFAEQQQFLIGDGVRFNFLPTQWGMRGGAATTSRCCSYKIKWCKDQAL